MPTPPSQSTGADEPDGPTASTGPASPTSPIAPNGPATPPRPPAGNLPGGASRQDRSPLARTLQRLMLLAAPRLRRLHFARRELSRRLRRRPHVVFFFHQVDDPYSHLALAAIPRLAERYSIELVYKLVPPADRLHVPEPERLAEHARRDCAWIAPHHGLAFPRDAVRPTAEDVRRVERVLAGRMGREDWGGLALELGRALWWNDPAARETLVRLEQARGIGSPTVSSETDAWARETAEAEARRMLAEGDRARRLRGHYAGGMFWYAGEWYWGVDRLAHLEERLTGLGLARDGPRPPLVAPPSFAGLPVPEAPGGEPLVLDFFGSLRSPYTAIAIERVLALPRRLPVEIVLRPVLPMVMRGLPVPAVKRFYILLDTRREAARAGLPFGRVCDPVGRPVERAFSLYPWARERGRAGELLASFTRAAFAEGVDTGSDPGLRFVVERAGLSWQEALAHLDRDTGWRDELEANRRELFALGLWGVPSFRLRGRAGEPDFATWGQDRLWRVEAEIRARCAGAARSS